MNLFKTSKSQKDTQVLNTFKKKKTNFRLYALIFFFVMYHVFLLSYFSLFSVYVEVQIHDRKKKGRKEEKNFRNEIRINKRKNIAFFFYNTITNMQ